MTTFKFLSPDSRSWSFDQRANGYARGEGLAVVVVKRLADIFQFDNFSLQDLQPFTDTPHRIDFLPCTEKYRICQTLWFPAQNANQYLHRYNRLFCSKTRII